MNEETAPRRSPREILDSILAKVSHLDLTDGVEPTNPVMTACGGYCDLFEGRWMRNGSCKSKVAVKRIRIHLQHDTELTSQFAKEIYIWWRLSHPNILPFCGYRREGNYFSLVSEWMEKGTARKYLKEQPDCDIVGLVTGIAEGLQYLHDKNIIHSDLKAENVLISNDGLPQICDFGILQILVSSQTFGRTSSQNIGTKRSVRWMSKELLAMHDLPITYSMESDIWAFGMTVYELLTMELPFFHLESDAQVMSNILQGNQPLCPTTIETRPVCYQKLWDLCQTCWDIPGKRSSIDYIISTLFRSRFNQDLDLPTLYRLILMSERRATPRCSPREVLEEVLEERAYLDLTDAVQLISPVMVACGGYCDVFEGRWLEDDSSEPHKVAVKRIRIHLGEAKFTRYLAREIHVWSGLHHPNILPFCGYLLEGNFPSLVSEWMMNGSVRWYLERHPDHDLLPLVIGIAEGLQYLHDKNIIHADLKAENVLISNDGLPQICDFGIMKILVSSQTFGGTSSQNIGTKRSVRWMSKELLAMHDLPITYSMESDIWAFGMTVYELLTKELPFFHLENDREVSLHISEGNQPSRPASTETWPICYQKLWNLCRACWHLYPGRRITIYQIDSALEALQNDNMCLHLSDLGRHEEALEFVQEAIYIREELSESNLYRFGPDLADSLHNKGSQLSALGRFGEALEASQRTVLIREALAKVDIGSRFKSDLANSLHNAAFDLSNLGRHEEALEADQRAVSIWEALAKEDPDIFNPDLASSLHNMCVNLSDLDRYEEAFEAILRAVLIREALSEEDPDRFSLDLAVSLQVMDRIRRIV